MCENLFLLVQFKIDKVNWIILNINIINYSSSLLYSFSVQILSCKAIKINDVCVEALDRGYS